MENPFVVGLVSWFLPGVGHMMQGKWRRGIVFAIVIWAMFIVAVVGGGAYYPGFDFKDGALLYLLNIFARFGNGLGALISYLISMNPSPTVAALATFEYSGRFLETAGLLNYLALLDAIDINVGRKK
jgi:hypothetical protein